MRCCDWSGYDAAASAVTDVLAVAVEDGAAVALVQDALATWGCDGYGHSEEGGERARQSSAVQLVYAQKLPSCPGREGSMEGALCSEKNSRQGGKGRGNHESLWPEASCRGNLAGRQV